MNQNGTDRLGSKDLRVALQFLREHCAPDTIKRFISSAVEGLFHLFPCIVANYGEIDRARHTGSLVSYPPEFATPQKNNDALSMGFQELGSLFQNRTWSPVRLSALVSDAKFKQTRMFQEHFRPFGGLDLLVIQHDRADGLAEFFSLFRQGYFSDRDQAMLDVVARPLQSALMNARALSYLSDHRVVLEAGLRNSGWTTLTVSRQGRILRETPEARRMLSFHFGSSVLNSHLPDDLRRWIGASCEVFENLSCTAPAESSPLSIATRGTLLVIRLLLHPSGCLLLLREEDETSEWKPLMQLGLTEREAQVLHLIAMGKTGPEIAILLGISHNTVRKHTSQIFIQLRVETRTAAALAAAEARKVADSAMYVSQVVYGRASGKQVVKLLQNR
jgi:DNA-binding CsgD family transcriptional regulator